MPHAEIDGRKLFYEREGEGEPLLLIQGLSGNHLHWGEDFLALLRPHFDVIAFDNRGIGHSDPVDGPFSIADMADDSAGLLDALGVESAHVLGISMGGMIGQELALRHPEKVRTLSLGCTYAGGQDSATTDPAVVQRLGELFMTGRVEEALRYGFEVNVSPRFAEDPAHFALAKDVAAQLPAQLDLLMLQVQAVAGHDTSERLGDIEAPTLVIHGTVDQMLPVSNAHAIAARIPGSRLEIFEDVGHAFWWERPEEAARFVRELASGASVES
jgi:pimeloyl-ACP methyl ester carboxylesterase